MDTKIKINDITTALKLFEDAAVKHGEATDTGDYKTGNKCYSAISKVIIFLKEHNEILNLLKFLNHSSSSVRLWAASFLLPVQEKEAIKTLEEISKIDGIISFDAKMTLQEWRNGNLKF